MGLEKKMNKKVLELSERIMDATAELVSIAIHNGYGVTGQGLLETITDDPVTLPDRTESNRFWANAEKE